VTSRICTTNNRFKRSKKKLCFSENFCWQTKNIQIFFGDNTRFTPGIEAWSPATGKMGFRMDTQKNQFRKEKGMTPYWPPVPTSRGTHQPKRYYRGRKPIKPNIYCFKRNINSVEYHIAQRFPRSCLKTKGARSIRTMCERQSKTIKFMILVESLFQNYWFCLIKCTLQCKTILWYRSPSREWTQVLTGQSGPLSVRLIWHCTCKILVVDKLTNSGHFTTCENEWNRRNTTKLVFPSLCPLKSRGEVFKNGFEIFQFRLNFNGTKT